METFLSTVTTIIGFSGILYGVYQGYRWHRLKKQGVRALASVVGTHLDNDQEACPILSFEYEGKMVEFECNQTLRSMGKAISYRVIYDPINRDMEIDSRSHRLMVILGPAIFGAITAAAGISMIAG